ncbi:ferrochelatase [bacterium]|nr:MAG: ferrochelatase [bacterium]
MNLEKPKTAVVLLQLGGPDSLEAVEPFLYNLFCDPDIIDLPGAFLFRRPLARLISSRRAPKVQALYRRIGNRSPILPQTKLQAQSLQKSLLTSGVTADVLIAMRYWHPFTEEAVRQVAAGGYDRVILLPLYPHYCKATTGSSVNEWNRCVRQFGKRSIPTTLIHSYFDHPLYIESLVGQIRLSLDRIQAEDRKKVHLVFSAHGTPMKLVRDGDPYSRHIRATYEAVVKKGAFGLPHHLCFQSKVGPQKWLEPSLLGAIASLAKEQVSHVLVVPVAFVTDHIETLSEINIEAKEDALKLGIRYFDMTPALIDNNKFIGCLSDLVIQELKRS